MILELIIDCALALAARFVIVSIGDLCEVDWHSNTIVWIITVVIAAYVAENYSFKKK